MRRLGVTVASLSVRSHVPVAPWEISGTMRSKIKMHAEKKEDEIWKSFRTVHVCVHV